MFRSRRLASRLLVFYAITFVALIGLFGYLGDLIARQALRDELSTGLERQAVTLAALLPEDDVAVWVDAAADEGGLRVTVIASDGRVVADSDADAGEMENHADRPEIARALSGEVGRATRNSVSTGFEQVYVAVPVDDGALRVSIPERELIGPLGDLRRRMLAIMGLLGLVGVTAVAFVARRLARPLRGLSETAAAIAAGDLDRAPSGSPITEIDELARSIGAMKNELATRLDAVETERRMLEGLLDALPQGTLLISGADEVVYANPAIGDVLSVVPESLHDVAPYRIQTAVREARLRGAGIRADLEHGRPTRILQTLATPVGEVGQVLVVVEDVTQKRRVESMRSDFVANASHELKTPVASILASLDALRIASQRDPDRAEHFTDLIERSARQLSRMVSDLLDLSRLESTDPVIDSVALHEVIDEEVQRSKAWAGEKDVVMEVDTEVIDIEGNEADLRLAVRNLLDNAIRYTDPGGSVSVTAGSGAGKVVVSVADTGSGIAQRHLDRIFERFYRVDESRDAARRGTGLGLAIVRHVVENHGGTVEVESELGVGSIFRMVL